MATRASKTHTLPADTTIGSTINKEDMAKLLANTPPAVTPPTVNPKPSDTVTYKGEQVTRARAVNLHAEEEREHGSTYLDPHDILDETIVFPLMKSKVASSMAWSMDVAIINAARGVFWQTYSEGTEGGHIDNLADFLNDMSSMRSNENYVEELGFEINGGRMQSIAVMLQLSHKWHDRAQQAALAEGRSYEPKSFETLLVSEKPSPVKADSIEKMRALALALSDEEDTPEEIEKLVLSLVQKATNRANEMHASHKMVIPAVLKIIQLAGYRNAGNDDAEFWQLPVETQLRFIDSMDKAIKRTLEDLSTYRSVTTIDYAGAIKEAKAAAKRINAVRTSAKFVNAG